MTAKKKVKEEDITIVPEPDQVVIPHKEAEAHEIKVIERIFETKEVSPQDVFGKLNRDQINLIKQTVAKGASDDELRLFIQVCKGANLNPFLKQVHLIPRWDARLGAETRTIQVSIDGFRAIAEGSGDYAGNEDPVYTGETEVTYFTGKEDKTPHTVKVPNEAKVTVYKIVHGGRYEFTATARWSEYYPGAKMGFQWHTRPYLMLGKCAEALALRKAFPKLLSGMYAQEELEKGATGQNQTDGGEQMAIERIKNSLKTFDMEQLDEFSSKMAKSTKYTKEQKVEFKKMVDERMSELTGIV